MQQLLAVALGLAFVFLLFSVLVSGVQELFSRIFKLRSSNLGKSLEVLLGSAFERNQLLGHPLLRNLSSDQPATENPEATAEAQPSVPPRRLPSYIPSRTFALALVDLLTRDAFQPQSNDPTGDATPTNKVATKPWAWPDIESAIARLPDRRLRQSLSALARAGDQNSERYLKDIEQWFDATMDRASGWYKRQVQTIVWAIAALVVCSLNVDAVRLTKALWADDKLRDLVVVSAIEDSKALVVSEASSADETPDSQPVGPRVAHALETIERLPLPIGWSDHAVPRDLLGVVSKILGLFFSIFAISLGAPFWFQAVQRFINLRGSGEVPARSQGSTESA